MPIEHLTTIELLRALMHFLAAISYAYIGGLFVIMAAGFFISSLIEDRVLMRMRNDLR